MARWTLNRVLAAVALALGALAPLVGGPSQTGTALDPSDPARIEAVEVAEWIMERRGVRLLDLRDSSRFAEFHLPLAERVPEDAIDRIDRSAGDTIVLYGDEESVGRVWRALSHGPGHVRFMVDGVGEWLSEIMNPVIAPDATPEERAAFDRVAAVSRYFGGLPKIGTRTGGDSSEQLLRRTVRRGCAF